VDVVNYGNKEPQWAPSWSPDELEDKGKEIMNTPWQKINALMLRRLFNWIEECKK